MWNVEEITGYKPKTTFWDDFTIAEAFGENAILDTYNRALREWKDNYIYLTELVMVLNHKIWHYYNKNNAYACLYNELWEKTDSYCLENLHGEELNYYYQTLD